MSLLNVVFVSIIIVLVIAIIAILFLSAFKNKNKDNQEIEDLKKNFHEKIKEKNEIIQHIKDEGDYLRKDKESFEQGYYTINNEYEKYKEKFVYSKEMYKNGIEDSKKKQRSTLRGVEFETIAPFLTEIPGHRKDLNFLGDPIDYICFEGKYENDQIEKIWFVEMKTNTSVLSKRQKQIKKCIEEGKVGFLEVKIKDDEIIIK